MSMQDVNIEFEVPTLPEMDVSLEIVTNSTFWGNIEGNIQNQTDLQNALNDKQDILTAGANIQIEDNVISATDTTYTAGEGISIEDNVISNTQTSAVWGTISGDITDQTDLIDLIDTKIDIEATARENNDLALQNGINTLNDDLTAEISNRGTADGILQDNIDTLSDTVTNNYNTLDGKIGDNKTAIDNHIADKTNPHEVTKSQVGLGNVDNTSDLNKPISTATQNALDGKVPTSRTVNSKALTSDITLTASDVDALPDTTTINDLTTAEQQSALNSGANSTNIGQIATNTQAILTEATNRQNADNNLQSQIDALVVASDVFDIVGTYAELQAYDISTVPVNDIIKVLVDSTHDNAATYYRCVENDNVKSWSYIGAEGAYYTKSEADNRFVEQTTTINGQALSNNITLTASDVGALPDSTTIGNGTLTIQKNGSTIDSFGANDTGNTTVNITVPTDTGDLTNNAGFITGINSTDVTTALGYTPYDSTNPDGYTDNVGTVTSVNNTQPDANGNVTLSIPAAQVNSDWNETDNTSKAYIQNKPNLSTVATTGDYTDLTNKPTIPTVGDGTITINQGGVQKGTFTTNQSGNTTIDLDAGGGSSTDVQINGTSITSGGVADIVTEGEYNASSNKIATMSDLAGKQDVLTTGEGITISELDDTRSIAKITDISGEWEYLAYGNNVYVAVSNHGMVITSADGETWINQGQKFNGTVFGITFGNGLFVVSYSMNSSNRATIYTSSDGVTWTNHAISNVYNARGITYGDGKFVVTCWQYILTSSDGENWTVTSVGTTNWINVAYGNGLFVAVGNDNYIMTSTNGTTWTTPKKISGSSIGYVITYGNGKFVIGERYVTTSTDGETWTTPVSVGNSMYFKSIIWVEDKFVAVGYRTGTYVGIITTSTDGTTWTTPVIKGTMAWRSVVAKGYDCVAIANDYSTKFTMKPVLAIYISPDSSLSSTSENAVQNKVIYTALNGKVDTSRTVNGKALSSNITLTTSDISNCESTTNKVTAINSSSTDTEYPTAKCMYDIIGDVETLINTL